MKKVLFLNSTLNLGGAERMLYEVAKHLDRTRFSVKICCLYGPGSVGNILISEGVDLAQNLMRNKYDIFGAYKLYHLIKKEGINVLCIEDSPLTLFWGFLFGRFLKIDRIVTVIHYMVKLGWWVRIKSKIIDRFILPGLDGIGVVSRSRLISLRQRYHLQPGMLVLIHNAVDLDRFRNSQDRTIVRKKISIPEGTMIIGMVGRLVYEKAYDIFLRAAQIVVQSYAETKFLIVGDGKKRADLERLVKILEIGRHVIFLGERLDVPDIVSIFDVAVLSSRIESFPLVLLEYMAASKPIVATDVGGNTEILQHGVSGIVVPSEDPNALAKAIIEILNDKKNAERLGRIGRKDAEDKFSLKAMISKIESFFELNGEMCNGL